MGFQSINEIEHFSFKDCELISFEKTEGGYRLELEALIVEAANSQNSNFTDSYAGTTILRLENAKILRAYEEGHRYYDADNRLLEEVPDRLLTDAETDELLAACKPGTYLFGMVKESEASADGQAGPSERAGDGQTAFATETPKHTDERYFYSLGIDLTETDSYWIYMSFTKAIFNWERYMNRVSSV